MTFNGITSKISVPDAVLCPNLAKLVPAASNIINAVVEAALISKVPAGLSVPIPTLPAVT